MNQRSQSEELSDSIGSAHCLHEIQILHNFIPELPGIFNMLCCKDLLLYQLVFENDENESL